MTNVLDVALSGMRAAQKGMFVTTNNVANSTNENYSRMQLNLSTSEGGGVKVGSVTNFADQSLLVRQLDATSSYNYGGMWAGVANNTEDFMTLIGTGFVEATNSFYSSFDDLASSPGNLEAKISVFSALETMELNYGSVNDHFTETKSSVRSLLEVEVETINNIAKNIAENNVELRSAQTEEQKLNLMVERDTMLKELASITDVRTNQLSNGEMDVYIGEGISLVSRSYPQEISVKLNAESNHFEFSMNDQDITDKISGGKLEGTLASFDDFVLPSINKTGHHAFNLAASINDVFAQWQDDNGNQIANSPVSHFTTTSVSPAGHGIDSAGNGAPIVFETSVNTEDFPPEDLGALPQEITIKRLSSGRYEIFDKKTGESIGTADDFKTPVSINGMSITSLPSTVDLQEGESIDIQPFVNANKQFETTYENASSINWGEAGQTVELAQLISNMGNNEFLHQNTESLKTDNPFFDNELITLSKRIKTTLAFDELSLEQLNQQAISVQGVSLDEEAANQIRYQELYEVSTQLVQTSKSMFSTLLNAIN